MLPSARRPFVVGAAVLALVTSAPAASDATQHAAHGAAGASSLAITRLAGCSVWAMVAPYTKDSHGFLEVDKERRAASFSDPGRDGRFVVTLRNEDRLSAGEEVVVHYAGLTESAVVDVDSNVGCLDTSNPFAHDERDTLETPFFTGAAFEQFAPGFANNEVHADAARAIAGMNAQYRLYRAGSRLWTAQLWVSGGYLAGLRSYCAGGTDPASRVVCQPTSAANIDAATPIIRDATSFEANVAVRFEFLALNRASEHPVNIYVVARDTRFGLDRATEAKFSDPVFGLGLVVVGGPLRGTSFQGGLGWSPFYAPHRGNSLSRFKIDFTLQAGASKSLKERLNIFDRAKDSFRYFFAIRTDFDDGPDADSVRIGTGIIFSPSAFFRAAGGKL